MEAGREMLHVKLSHSPEVYGASASQVNGIGEGACLNHPKQELQITDPFLADFLQGGFYVVQIELLGGVETYFADLIQGQKTYYGAEGEVCVSKLDTNSLGAACQSEAQPPPEKAGW